MVRQVRSVPGTLQEGGAPFYTTNWGVVQSAAQSRSSTTAQEALTEFCQAYWPPLYAFLRRQGRAPADAQDLTQGFFAHLLAQNTLSRADREKGRLRTFLLGSLQYFLVNEHDHARAHKRGGGRQIVSMDEFLPEVEASLLTATGFDDTGSYDQTWAATLVSRAWEQLKAGMAAEGKARVLEELGPFLLGGAVALPSQEHVAARLGWPVATLRTSLLRLRQRYRRALRLEVARTVSDPAEIDDELRYLYRLLSS